MTCATPRPGSRDPGARSERERIERVYRRYASDPYFRKIWFESAASRLILERKWGLIRQILSGSGIDLNAARVLDVGAGDGRDCARWRDLGARADRIVAFDLLRDAARQARLDHPWMAAVTGDAASLPFRDEVFDLVYQSTMVSSVLAPARRERLLGEVRRVLAPGGLFVSYDTRYPNPMNRNTRPLREGELARAFDGWSLEAWSLTAVPPLQRVIAPLAPSVCRALERVPPLRTHLLALIRRPC